MIPSAVRLHNPAHPDRVAVVSAHPRPGDPDRLWLRVARGAEVRRRPDEGAFRGPFPEDELAERFARAIDALRAEGFAPSGLHELIASLKNPSPQIRARAALRLGWLGHREAVGPLLDALPGALDDACSILDALGMLGDPSAIPALRAQAARKLLARRRSAVEALRRLGDADGPAEAAHRMRQQYPMLMWPAIDAVDPSETDGLPIESLIEAVLALPENYRGLALDTLYEVASPAASAAVRGLLPRLAIDEPFLWRYAKSILKRSMLRLDHPTFARLVVLIERRARKTKGKTATLKSGYDGIARATPYFQRKTQDYMRRLGWRHLRLLARHRPDQYAPASAEVLIEYSPDDAEEPHGLRGALGRCYVLNRILYGASDRFRFDARRLVFYFRSADSTAPPRLRREESYAERWDARPRALLRVVTAATLPEAHAFAARALADLHRVVLEGAPIDDVLRMLAAPSPPTVELGLSELRRRFDPARPDWALLALLLEHDAPEARAIGREWLRQSAPTWSADLDRLLAFVTAKDAATALLAADLAIAQLPADPSFRRALAARLVDWLGRPEPHPESHQAPARLARAAIPAEVGALLSVRDLVAWIASGTPPVQSLAGDLLARRPEAIEALGIEGLSALAAHEVADVRDAAVGLIRLGLDAIRDDPSVLFVLAESDWDDVRAAALAMLRDEVGDDRLGFDGLMGLLDSNRPDVQELGRSLVRRRSAEWSSRVLMERLIEHPDPGMRRFALDLVVGHLPDGGGYLSAIAGFFRRAVLDPRPDRLLKLRVIDFLLSRGLRDAGEAEAAARLLAEFARLETKGDAGPALEALVRLALAYPKVGPMVGLGLAGGGA